MHLTTPILHRGRPTGLGSKQKTWPSELTNERKVLLGHLQSILHDRNTSVRDETSNGTHLGVNLLERLLHQLLVPNIALPSFDLDIVLLGDLSSDVLGVLGRVVDDGYVTAGASDRLGDGAADTAVTASDDGGGFREIDCRKGKGQREIPS